MMEELLGGNLAKETSLEDVAAIFQVCWAIWKARNSFFFAGKFPNPGQVIENAKIACSDYLVAMFRGLKVNFPKPARDCKWVPPPSSVNKFNCDGASIPHAAWLPLALSREIVVDMLKFGVLVESLFLQLPLLKPGPSVSLAILLWRWGSPRLSLNRTVRCL
ncbi:uncharacterized protein LOC131302422 isoform X2 [Rhododendron vialii]|uniref:uncharacterized protein LOC131302422 isoform X2 n=1 Tax=Rhododendron vialii TaxID=182163 RepID=UPI00265EABC8|nr:uncharacterized protein LOC131302422 isoform X2 [Rhododendron vialii]XP_058185055.1 uncharacterized protein LOC131302422 isoform X2 [Rhododendron vialii]XP_058185056.1 uncharacterized protein LOC131302422 isoform X2 [Rhododendron vialii]